MSELWEKIWYPNQPEGWARRAALSPLSAAALFFRAAVECRNAAYSSRWLKAVEVEGASVVSIGNLNVGGTGKTPAVIYLANLCSAQGRRVAVLSRGYARKGRDPLLVTGAEGTSSVLTGDEPLLIARRCPAAVVLVGANRAELAQCARRDHRTDLILLDDGLQYRRLRKDLEVVVVDESVGLGNGRLLPRGPLRETTAALARADLLWIRADAERSFPARGRPSIRVRYAASAVLSPTGEEHPPTVIRDRQTFAFAGVARPGSFLRTVRELSAKLVGARFFADHHLFTRPELDRLLSDARALKAEMLITTEKDRVRLPAQFPAWTIRLDLEVLEGGDTLSRRLALL